MMMRFNNEVQSLVNVKAYVHNARQLFTAMYFLFIQFSLVGYVLAFWRLGQDLQLTDQFFISNGLLSHWQVWLVMAVGFHFMALQARRFSSDDESQSGR